MKPDTSRRLPFFSDPVWDVLEIVWISGIKPCVRRWLIDDSSESAASAFELSDATVV